MRGRHGSIPRLIDDPTRQDDQRVLGGVGRAASRRKTCAVKVAKIGDGNWTG